MYNVNISIFFDLTNILIPTLVHYSSLYQIIVGVGVGITYYLRFQKKLSKS